MLSDTSVTGVAKEPVSSSSIRSIVFQCGIESSGGLQRVNTTQQYKWHIAIHSVLLFDSRSLNKPWNCGRKQLLSWGCNLTVHYIILTIKSLKQLWIRLGVSGFFIGLDDLTILCWWGIIPFSELQICVCYWSRLKLHYYPYVHAFGRRAPHVVPSQRAKTLMTPSPACAL